MLPSLTKPSEPTIQAFLAQESQRPFSYPEVGQSLAGSPPGYDVDHNRVELGQGTAAFDAACSALRHWRQFPKPWTDIYPLDTPLVTGNTVAMLARVFGLWWLNSCRIVYTIDESLPVRRFGFAYGTLPGHVECGEERFLIECDSEGRVWYDLRAFSKPRLWLVRLSYPLARRQQGRFVRDSQAVLRAAVASQPKT